MEQAGTRQLKQEEPRAAPRPHLLLLLGTAPSPVSLLLGPGREERAGLALGLAVGRAVGLVGGLVGGMVGGLVGGLVGGPVGGLPSGLAGLVQEC